MTKFHFPVWVVFGTRLNALGRLIKRNSYIICVGPRWAHLRRDT